MARHALIDLCQVFQLQQKKTWQHRAQHDRLPASEFNQLCGALADANLRLCGDSATSRRLRTIRSLYEPHALALAGYLRMPLPAWVAPPREKDQWNLLTRLRSEAVLDAEQAKTGVASSFLREDEHSH